MTKESRRFDGRIAIVTGGGHGIGETYCRAFAENGARVVVAEVDRDAGAQRMEHGEPGVAALLGPPAAFLGREDLVDPLRAQLVDGGGVRVHRGRDVGRLPARVRRRFVQEVLTELRPGAIGVIGPTRLNYARIIPMVDYTAKVIGRLIG